MNRKIRVIILTMVLTVLMFGGTRLMAQDNLDVNTKEASQTVTPKNEGKVEPMAKEGEEGESSVETDKNTEIDGNEANGDEVNKTETETPEAKENGKTEKTETTEEAPKQKAPEAPKTPEEPKGDGTEEPKGDGTEEPKSEESKPEEPKPEEETLKEPTPEVDPDEDKDLSELKAEIDKEQDPDKKAALQKEYNEKYLEKVEADGKDKLDKEVVNSFTDSKRNGQYKEIQELYDKIQSDRRDGKLNQEDIDKLNKLLGEFKPPRKLTDEEKKAKDKFNEDYEIPRVKEYNDDRFKKYEAARQALKDALDPEKEGVTPEELKNLQEAYAKAKADLDKAIKNKEITPQYTKGQPEIKVYPLDGSTPGKELDGDTYYIPDNTSANLLLEVRKDDGGDFTFTIKPNKTDEKIPDAVLQDLVRTKDGNALTLKKNDDGTYSFKTSNKFTIAQIQMNLPAFSAAFHEGFEIEMTAGVKK